MLEGTIQPCHYFIVNHYVKINLKKIRKEIVQLKYPIWVAGKV